MARSTTGFLDKVAENLSAKMGGGSATLAREHDAAGWHAMGIFEAAYKELQPERFEDLFMLQQSKLL